ncbi:hypothetical protein BLNAU_9270 [Blattamonas nauphoetae]|uniref:Uncharacterized protein n=1 Tax=Blattamonas nauphoetae TaxID=2049346 RepID=A0ABQ9XW78_9EUKA|nr:hypothetical protein BLNAU_9270 [Blattamonas nauphoetae]
MDEKKPLISTDATLCSIVCIAQHLTIRIRQSIRSQLKRRLRQGWFDLMWPVWQRTFRTSLLTRSLFKTTTKFCSICRMMRSRERRRTMEPWETRRRDGKHQNKPQMKRE